MHIEYKVDAPITTEQFIEVLNKSTLGERRPVDDYECMEGMVNNANLNITAWHRAEIIGIARSITDYNYSCYLADLAVDKKYQNMGIGKKLIKLTQAQLGPKCSLLLLAAPAANSYYEHIGFENNPRCWVLGRNDERVDG